MPEQDKDLLEAEKLMKSVRAALDAQGVAMSELTVAASPGGQVALFGFTTSPDLREHAVAIARSVPGVTLVSSGIMVV